MNAKIFFLLTLTLSSAKGADIPLTWEDTNIPPVDSFTLKWGTDCNNPTNSVDIPGTARSYTLKNVDPTVVWCFGIIAKRGTEVSPTSNLITPFLASIILNPRTKAPFDKQYVVTVSANKPLAYHKVTAKSVTGPSTISEWQYPLNNTASKYSIFGDWPATGYVNVTGVFTSVTNETINYTLPYAMAVYPTPEWTIAAGPSVNSCTFTSTHTGTADLVLWTGNDFKPGQVGTVITRQFPGPGKWWITNTPYRYDITGASKYKLVIVGADGSCSIDTTGTVR